MMLADLIVMSTAFGVWRSEFRIPSSGFASGRIARAIVGRLRASRRRRVRRREANKPVSAKRPHFEAKKNSRKRAQRSVAATNEDQATANRRELAGSTVASLWRNNLFASIRVHSWLEESSRKSKIPSYSSAENAKRPRLVNYGLRLTASPFHPFTALPATRLGYQAILRSLLTWSKCSSRESTAKSCCKASDAIQTSFIGIIHPRLRRSATISA